MIEAKVILASVTKLHDIPLYTLQLKYHRYIHGEFLTHRVFSRNSSSSRAIPIKKVLSQVWNDPAMPVEWGSNQPGMQAHTQLSGAKLAVARLLWRVAAKTACIFAWGFSKVGLAKQVGNRILEPWQWMHTVVTATDWGNFFELRRHPDAQPEFRELAEAIWQALESAPRQLLCENEWHLPYLSREDVEGLTEDEALMVSAARCARVSYLAHDGKKTTKEEDLKLAHRLVGSVPIHASPIEHQGKPASRYCASGNFSGWIQHRKWRETKAQITKSLQEPSDDLSF